MDKKTISADVPEDLYERFTDFVTVKGRGWRGSKEVAYKAMDTAVQIALEDFLKKHQKPDTSVGKEA